MERNAVNLIDYLDPRAPKWMRKAVRKLIVSRYFNEAVWLWCDMFKLC